MTIGVSTPRIDGIEKVTGAAKFTGDIAIPGLLEARVLRSPLPHAAIEAIDIRKAEALAGVVAVLTRDDLKDIDPFYGNCLRDRAIVAMDRVRFVGEPVAVVAAEDALIAEEALGADRCSLQRAALRGGHRRARAEGAPLLHRKCGGSGRVSRRRRRG